MSDVKYDPEECERLVADIRAEVARTPYAAHRAVVADQLEAARREIELMRQVVEAAEGYVHGPNLIGSVIDAVDAYRAATKGEP